MVALMSRGRVIGRLGKKGLGANLILDGTSPTGAYSVSRKLLKAFSGSRYVSSGGAVSQLNDQSPAGMHLTQATGADQPLLATVGGRDCLDFSATDKLAGPAISNFISASSGYGIISFRADSITGTSANVFSNDMLFGDLSGFMGVFLKDTGSLDTAYGYNWDTNADAASSVSVVPGSLYVMEWKHTGGNVSLRVNGGSWIDVASGDTGTLTGALQLSGGTVPFDGQIFEFAIWNTVPANVDAIASDFRTWVGATNAPVIVSGLVGNGTVGQAFSYQIQAANVPTSYSASGLPAGLSINTSSGLISGTPTGAATTNVTINAINAGGSDSEILVLSVIAAGGAAMLAGETDGFAADFTCADASKRVAVKVAGVVTEYSESFLTGAANAKLIDNASSVWVYTPHNLCIQSQAFNVTWAGTGTAVTADATTAPDGTTTADKVNETATTNQHQLAHATIASIQQGQPVLFSVCAKAAERSWISVSPTSASQTDWFDLTNGVVGTSANGGTIESLGSGWYRCTIKFLAGATVAPTICVRQSNGQTGNYLGVANNGVYLWGAQCTKNQFQEPYIATTTAARYSPTVDYDPVTHAVRDLVVEGNFTQLALWTNDFTNAVWVKTNMTASLTAQGPQGVNNTASIITATAANATVLQTITSASQTRTTQVMLKRRTGTGNIDVTTDGGTTWTTVAITSSWARYSIPNQVVTNPVVGIRIATSGDAVDVAFFNSNTAAIVPFYPVWAAGSTVALTDGPTLLLSAIPWNAAGPNSVIVRAATMQGYFGGGSLAYMWLHDTTDNEKYTLDSSGLTKTGRMLVTDGGVTQADIGSSNAPVVNTYYRVGGAMALNDFAVVVDGGTPITDNAGTLPTPTTLLLGRTRSGAGSYSRVKSIMIVPRRMSNTELQSKTA